jgi:hypothetical protein
MAMENLMGIMSIAPLILRDLPLIMGLVQVIGFVFLSMFYGSIAIRGYKGYLNGWVRIAVRLGIGFFCLVLGIAISGLLPMASANPFFVMILGDMVYPLIGGMISSFIVMAAVYLTAHNIFDIERMRLYMKRLEEKLGKAEQIKRIEEKKTPLQKLKDPYRISGIVLLAVIVIFILATFRGFPDMNKSVLSAIGLEQSDIDMLLKKIGADQDMPPGCDNVLIILQQYSDDIANNRLPQTTDAAASNLVTSQGHTPMAMYEVTYNGADYILAMTSDTYMCHIREGVLCGCLDVSSFMTVSK